MGLKIYKPRIIMARYGMEYEHTAGSITIFIHIDIWMCPQGSGRQKIQKTILKNTRMSLSTKIQPKLIKLSKMKKKSSKMTVFWRFFKFNSIWNMRKNIIWSASVCMMKLSNIDVLFLQISFLKMSLIQVRQMSLFWILSNLATFSGTLHCHQGIFVNRNEWLELDH